MFFQDTPPDTSGYMIAGYAIFFVVMAVYLISFYLRYQNLHRDLTVLENLKQESRPATGKTLAKASPPKRKTRAASSANRKKRK